MIAGGIPIDPTGRGEAPIVVRGTALYEVDPDAVTVVALGLVCLGTLGIICPTSGCDTYNPPQYDGYTPPVDGDSGGTDVHHPEDGTGVDEDGDSAPDGGDASCSTPRAGINDNYADTVFASVPCDLQDLDIIGGRIFGVCGYPVNRLLTCQIQSDPMESTSCDTEFTLEPVSELPDGTLVENHPILLENLDGERLAILYDTPGDSSPTSVSVLSSYTFANVQEDFALPAAMEVDSGSSSINTLTTGAQAMGLSRNSLIIATANFDGTGTDMMYSRGTLLFVRPMSIADSDFNPDNVRAIFTNGRNPSAIGQIDDHTIAVLNAHGDRDEIPPEASSAALAATCTDALDVQNKCEIAGASIDIIDVTNSANPIMERTISVADVKMQALSELAITEDKTMAVVGSAGVPPVIYSVPLDATTAVRQVTLPATATGNIVSIELEEGTSLFAFVTLDSGEFYKVNLDSMTVVGGATQLGRQAGAAVFNPEGALYQGVTGPYCEPTAAEESRIIAVDPDR